jgi:hypothetical protein
MNYKCFHCLREGHTFENCSDVKCACNCVDQLSSFPKNDNLDSLSSRSPHFLHIKNREVSALIYPYKQMNKFMRIRVREQILGKKTDKRKTRV